MPSPLIVGGLAILVIAEVFQEGARLQERSIAHHLTMAIHVKLDRVLLKQGITLTELGERVGLTLANLSVQKTNKARAVRFTTLDALCQELDCQPGDLLEWVPE